MIQTYFKRKFRISTNTRRQRFVDSVMRELVSVFKSHDVPFEKERDVMFTPIDGSSWNDHFGQTILVTIWNDYPSRTLADAMYVGRAEVYKGDEFECSNCGEDWSLYIPLDIESADYDIVSPVCGHCLLSMYDQLRSKR